MGRKQAPNGEERVSANGYTYVKCPTGFKLKHHLVAYKKYGRWPSKEERCYFVDGDRTNFDPDNIKLATKDTKTIERKRAQLEARIHELQGQLEEL